MSLDAQLESRSELRAAGPGARQRITVRGARWVPVAVAGGAAAAVVPYAVAVAGPLRLGTDSVTYLGLADHIRLPPDHQTYPPLYPALLRLTEHLGLGSAWGFAAMQLAVLAMGLLCVYLLCRRPLGLDPLRASLVCVAVLLCHQFLILTSMVGSDVPYFTVAMLALLALERAEERSGSSRYGLLALGCGLTALAIGVRVAGVALVPAVLIVAVGRTRIAAGWHSARRRPVLAAAAGAGALVVVVVIGVLLVRATGYADDVAYVWRGVHSTAQLISRIGVEAKSKIFSVGDLGTQANTRTPPSAVVYLSAAALVLLVAVGWMARRRIGPIEAFVLGTALVVVAYAGAVPRFWIGAFPFLVAYALIAAERLDRFPAAWWAVRLWALGYVVVGAVLAVHSIGVSTSGREFPDQWENQPEVAATYRVAFGEGRPGDEALVMPAGVEELRRYEPLARPRR